MKTLHIKSYKQIEMIDITSRVVDLVHDSEVKNGLAVIYTPHTTAAITVNENADPDVKEDILMEMSKIVPSQDSSYRHLEGNSAAHIKSSLFGTNETLIIHNGRALLGTWQGVFFCEFDGPRERQVQVKIIGT